MNWKRLKEKFPNTHDEIREFSETYKGNKMFLMHSFVASKGYKVTHSWINQLREIEKNNAIHLPRQRNQRI